MPRKENRSQSNKKCKFRYLTMNLESNKKVIQLENPDKIQDIEG